MRFDQISHGGTATAVAQRIARAISQGRLSVGDRLPSERDLSEQLGVSRQTVRRAVKTLEDAGVIAVIAGRGAGSGARVLTNLVPVTVLGPDREPPSFTEVATVLEARRMFEPPVAVLAGMRMDDDDYEAMAEVIQLQRDADDLHGVRGLDLRFHLAIASATHNRLIHTQMDSLMQQLDIARHVVSLDSERERRDTIDIHERTLEAIASRSTTRIVETMDEHLRMMEDAWERATSRSLADQARQIVPTTR